MTMTPVHMHHHGGSVTIVGLTISLHVAGMYAFAPVVGVLADRRGARTAVAVGLVVLAVALLLAAALPLSTPGLVAALVLLGVGWSFVNVAGSTLFAQSLAADDRAPAQGGIDAVTNLCAAVAAFASGPLLALTGFPVLAGLALLALVPLAVLVTRPRRWA